MEVLYERLETIGAGAILLLGIALVVLPEPSTSLLGGVLIILGLSLWAVKWRKQQGTPEREPPEEASPLGPPE